jgi:D-3-phosphoglycerate dehydrogenase
MPRLRDQIVGLVGLGRIGARFAEMVRPLVAGVLVYDPAIAAGSLPRGDVTVVTFDELLVRSDYISIHCPLTAQTRNMFSHEALARMRSRAYLINCSRGGIIDEFALVEALKTKRIAGAALDVFAEEPLAMDSPLRDFADVIITPHVAWYSAEADFLLRANPASSIVRFFAGEQVRLLNDSLVPRRLT